MTIGPHIPRCIRATLSKRTCRLIIHRLHGCSSCIRHAHQVYRAVGEQPRAWHSTLRTTSAWRAACSKTDYWRNTTSTTWRKHPETRIFGQGARTTCTRNRRVGCTHRLTHQTCTNIFPRAINTVFRARSALSTSNRTRRNCYGSVWQTRHRSRSTKSGPCTSNTS